MKLVAKFKIADVLPLALHSIANVKHHRAAWPNDNVPVLKPSILIVKDEGLYLMSPFTLDGAPPEAKYRKPDSEKLKVIYAEGFGPDCDYIGGDDFGDLLDIAEDIVRFANMGRKTMRVTITDEYVSTTFLKR